MRPVVVIRKYNKNLALILPTSTKIKNNPYYHPIKYKNNNYSVLLSQARVIDTKRFKKKVVELSQKDFQSIQIVFVESVLRQKIDL